MFQKSLAFLLLVYSSFSSAYLVTVFNKENIDYTGRTRILVTGAGDDLGMQFQFVARNKAVKYSDLYPNDQIILLAKEESDLGDNSVVLKNVGFKTISNERKDFNGKSLVKELLKFNKIASLDIFSHSSAQYGIHLDGKAHRFTLDTKGVSDLKNNFTGDAYAQLHGCNTGFNLAPYLSREWEIPVFGSLTSTNFQRLHSDGNFYLTEEGKFPNTLWAAENSLSFNSTKACKFGGCLRLKPDNNHYVGYWGEYYNGGLPFYKVFCVKNSEESCLKSMGQALLSFSSIISIDKNVTFENYKKVVLDFLCPVSSKSNLRDECISKLEESLLTKDDTYNPFSRPQIECDFKECKAEIKCEKIFLTGVFKPGSCTLENKMERGSSTIVREFKSYLNAYKYLK